MQFNKYTHIHTQPNEGKSGDVNGDEDGNGEGNKDGIRNGGEEAEKRKKPYKSCRRKQAFSFRMRHHLCRQGVTLAGPRQLCSQGLVSVNGHRTE